MLVCDVQLVELPQPVVPSLVRFEGPDGFEGVLGDPPLYFGFRSGFELLRRVRDEEHVVFVNGLAVRDDHLAKQEIQRGSRVVDHVARCERDLNGGFFNPRYHPEFVAALVVVVGSDFVGVGFKKDADLPCEVVDVLFGPFNLGQRALC